MSFLKEINSQIYYSVYRRKFKEAFKNSSHTYTEREGIILRYRTSTEEFYGEAPSSLSSPEKSQKKNLSYLQNTSAKNLIEAWQKNIPSMPASIKVALDSIATNMEPIPPHKNIRLNAILPIQKKPIKKKIETLYKKGFRVFKVKVEENTVDSILHEFKEAQKIYPNIKIRLDSNQNFSLKKLNRMETILKEVVLEYWEDPFPPSAIESWLALKRLSIPTSLDQGCAEEAIVEQFLEKDICNFFTLKPSGIGSFKKCSYLIKRILSFKKRYIISSSLETELGLLSLMKFSMLQKDNTMEQGLATAFLFSEPHFQDQAEIDASFLERKKRDMDKKLKKIKWEKLK